ncbi:unnamed protein product [Prorocentrum cordatum]|uniref:Apple domain-containing protein n=1 Tax=Prorocentrum cordatum TaxID=2364126 RepID=A0ABN9SP61_9DINO|nr:unnamed protein product [Polarella glacialis]
MQGRKRHRYRSPTVVFAFLGLLGGSRRHRWVRLDVLVMTHPGRGLGIGGICIVLVSPQKCRDLAGCTSFSYQPGACKALSGRGRCYLWSGECDHWANECWDTYNLSERERKPASWRKTASRYGCSNWKEAKIANSTIEISASACASKCADTKGCVGVNFQPGHCSGSEMMQKGSCYMWKQRCLPEYNSCWDLYEELVSTVLVSPSSVGDLSLDVESEDGFEIGDRVFIQSALFTEIRILVGVGPLMFADGAALDHDFPAGSTVTTPIKPIEPNKSRQLHSLA